MKHIVMDLFMLAFSLAISLTTPSSSEFMYWIGWAGVAVWSLWLLWDSITLIRSKRHGASATAIVPEP